MLASEIPFWFVRLFAFAFGAVWGSFANVVIYRWPRELSVVNPPSHCFACKHPVAAYDNVPIFAYLWLRGRCRHCGARFSPRYAIVELLFAVISTAIAERVFFHAGTLEPTMALAHYAVRFVVACVLLITTFIDLDEMIVPSFAKWFALVPLGAAFVLPSAEPTVDPVHAVAGAALGYLGLRLLFIDGYRVLTGRRGMGLGDAEILLLVGALLGPAGVLFTLGAGAVQGVIATVIVSLAGGRIGPAHADDVEDIDGDEDDQDEDDEEEANNESDAVSAPVETAPTGEPGTPKESESSALTPARDDAPPRPDSRPMDSIDSPPTKSPLRGRAKIPFVPFLALAALEYLLGADQFVQAYLRFIRGE